MSSTGLKFKIYLTVTIISIHICEKYWKTKSENKVLKFTHLDNIYAPASPRETRVHFTNKGDPGSGNPNPADLACTKPAPCQGMRRQKKKSKAVSKKREVTTSLSPTQLCNPKHVVPTLLLGQKTAA